jgi:uncharacterized protein (TIGR00730 family)
MRGFWHGQAMRRLAVYCGSRSGHAPEHGQAATALGRAMARRGVGLVYGAAQIGLMGTIADAVLAADGEVIGVIPEALMDAEVAHHQLTRLEVVADMHVRKARTGANHFANIGAKLRNTHSCTQLEFTIHVF